MYVVVALIIGLLTGCAGQPATRAVPTIVPVTWRGTGAHQRIVLSYLSARYDVTGDSLDVELCPQVSSVVDSSAIAQLVTSGKLAIRSMRSVSESRCSGAESRTSGDQVVRILSTRFTGDSFIVMAERRRPSRYPHSWRERWIELANDPTPQGSLEVYGWPSIE